MKPLPKVRLGKVLNLDLARVPIDAGATYPMVGVLSFGRGLFEREPIENGKTSYRLFYRLKAEHVVMSQLFGWEGALALSSEKFAGRFLSPQFPTFLCDVTQLDREFLGYVMRSPAFWEDLGTRASGMGDRRRTLNPDALFACEIPLPSLAEQRRIVVRIETLAIQITEARSLRQQAAEQAEAILKAYLNRLFGNPYEGTEGNLGISNWLKLDEVVDDVADGPHITPTYAEGGVPFITVLNITSGRIRFADHKFITAEDHRQFQKRAKAEKGDVLLSKDGTIGVPCLVDTDREFSFFVSVALIKPKRGLLDGEFLTWAIRAPYLQERIALQSRGDMIRHLVLREIRDLTVPVPPIREQRRIVAMLEAFQKDVNNLKRLQAETAAELDALMPSILSKAFSGEL